MASRPLPSRITSRRRSGATVVLFHTASGTGSPADVPDALVSAQIRTLEQA